MREAAGHAPAGHGDGREDVYGAGHGHTMPAAEPGYHPAANWPGAAPQPAYDAAHGQQSVQYPDYDARHYQAGYPAATPEACYGVAGDDQALHGGGFSHSLEPAFGAGQYDDPRFAYASQAASSLDEYRLPSETTSEPSFGAPSPYFGEQEGDGRYSATQDGVGMDENGHDDEYEYDDDEEESGRYGWKLMAAMVVAGVIVVGGGVFLYDMLAGGGGTSENAPVIKADRGPAKTAPAEPGGKSFANKDSKLLGRLDSSNAASRRVELDSDARGRVREVPTVRVSPDGRLILPKEPQGLQTAENNDSGPAAPSVPGINIVDSLSGSRSGLGGVGLPPVVPKAAEPVGNRDSAPSSTPTAAQQPASSPSAPIIRNRSTPSEGGNLATARTASPPPVPQKSAISSAWRMAQPARATTRPSTGAAAAAPATTASTLGAAAAAQGAGVRKYIAVVATKSTRMEALGSFAELQQRYPQALSNRVPTVQEADLSSRGLGMMYRLLLGPAGSRQAANTVCANLKAGGYSGCWVKVH